MFHVLQPVNQWLEPVRMLPEKATVKATAVQWLAETRAANPGVFTWLRYINDDIQDVNPDDTDEIRANRARDWFNRFIDGTFLNGETAGIPHWQATNAICWWNEYYANSQGPAEKEQFWQQERIAAKVWLNEYRNGPHAAKLSHIRLAICATAVGNDIPIQSAVTASQYDCILDYHGYDKFLSLKQRDPYSWQFHCGRWNTMDQQFREAGYELDFLLGETGPYFGVYEGWRHGKVLGGDVGAYVDAVETFIKEIQQTHAYQTGRMLGFSLFTTGGNWPLYATNTPEMMKLAEVIRAEWRPGESAPPVEKPKRLKLAPHWDYLNVRESPMVTADNSNKLGAMQKGMELVPIEYVVRDGEVWVKYECWSAQEYHGNVYLIPAGDD